MPFSRSKREERVVGKSPRAFRKNNIRFVQFGRKRVRKQSNARGPNDKAAQQINLCAASTQKQRCLFNFCLQYGLSHHGRRRRRNKHFLASFVGKISNGRDADADGGHWPPALTPFPTDRDRDRAAD